MDCSYCPGSRADGVQHWLCLLVMLWREGKGCSTAGGAISCTTYPIPKFCYLFPCLPLNKHSSSYLERNQLAQGLADITDAASLLAFHFVVHSHFLFFTICYKSTLKQPLSVSRMLQLPCSTFINFSTIKNSTSRETKAERREEDRMEEAGPGPVGCSAPQWSSQPGLCCSRLGAQRATVPAC